MGTIAKLALAILHTSHELRGESIDTLRSLTQVKLKKLNEVASRSCMKMIDMVSIEGKLQSIEDHIRRRTACLDGRARRKTIYKLARNQILFRLSRLPMELPCSTLGYEGKRWEVIEFCMQLTSEDKSSLVGDFIGCGDIFDALMKIVDSGVEPHKKEQ